MAMSNKARKPKTSKRSAEVAKRNKKIAAAYADGASVPELSEQFSLSTIMVYRYLKALGVSLRVRPGRPTAPMSEEVKAILAEGRKEKMAVDEAKRIAKMRAYRPPTWRRRELELYVARVLAVRGGERMAFMDLNPIKEVFR